jgi:hypothetical protein
VFLHKFITERGCAQGVLRTLSAPAPNPAENSAPQKIFRGNAPPKSRRALPIGTFIRELIKIGYRIRLQKVNIFVDNDSFRCYNDTNKL